MELCRFHYPEQAIMAAPMNREQRRAANSKAFRKSMRRNAEEAKESADAERALIERAEKAEAQIPKWIPVSERLPEENRLVLFTAGKENEWILVGFVEHGKWFNYEDFAVYPVIGRCECYPTHWQSLPLPPSE